MDESVGDAVGTAINIAVPGPDGNSGTLTVAPEGVEDLITNLRDADIVLRELGSYTRQLHYVDPPGDDPYSCGAAGDITRVGRQWIEAHGLAHERFLRVIEGLLETLQTYATAEVGNAVKFRGGS